MVPAFIKSKWYKRSFRMIWDVWRYRPRYWFSDQCSQLLARTCSSIENKQWSKQSLIPAKILVFESSIVDSDQKVKSFSAFHFPQATRTQTGKRVTYAQKLVGQIAKKLYALRRGQEKGGHQRSSQSADPSYYVTFCHRCLRYHLTKWICWNIHTHSAMMTLGWQVS